MRETSPRFPASERGSGFLRQSVGSRNFAGDGVSQRGSVGAEGVAVDLDCDNYEVIEPAGAFMCAPVGQVASGVTGELRRQEVDGVGTQDAEEARGSASAEGAQRVVLDVHVEFSIAAALDAQVPVGVVAELLKDEGLVADEVVLRAFNQFTVVIEEDGRVGISNEIG